MGNIKPKNEWIHTINWDLVVFDEYHFGAWRDSAKDLFEGEDDVNAEIKAEYGTTLSGRAAKSASIEDFEEEFEELARAETDFLPITTRAYLYLSGTPFRALATGEFIEEQIFNWTYTDEQRARAEFAAKHPDTRNPYAAMPQMRLLTYQMPDELLAIASAGEFDEFDLNVFEAKGREHRPIQTQERRAEVAGHHPRQLPARNGGVPENRHGAVSILGLAPASLSAALVLVPAQRRSLPCHGQPAGREAQRLLA